MNIQQIKQSVRESIFVYRNLLNEIPEDDFQKTPAAGGWSYSQVYSHIIDVNQLSLISMEKCINGTAKRDSRRLHWKVWLIMFLGRFPPGRLKAPERIEAMVNKISREEAKNQLIRFSERFEEVSQKIHKALPDRKVSHPRLGPLNAPQWLRFIDIHTRHHIRQLYRIRSGISA